MKEIKILRNQEKIYNIIYHKLKKKIIKLILIHLQKYYF